MDSMNNKANILTYLQSHQSFKIMSADLKFFTRFYYFAEEKIFFDHIHQVIELLQLFITWFGFLAHSCFIIYLSFALYYIVDLQFSII